MRLKREAFRHIEAEIRVYHGTLRAMEELRRQIILGGSSQPLKLASGQGYITSAVERRATRLADSLLLREMERITHAIRETYEVAREECRQVLWARFGLVIEWEPPAHVTAILEGCSGLRVREIAEALQMDESTFHRYRTGFVYAVADKLGWF